MGFDVLNDIIDHNRYDLLDSPVERQSVILDMLMEMLDTDLDLMRLRQAAAHNQRLMERYANRFEIDCLATIDQAVEYKYVSKY